MRCAVTGSFDPITLGHIDIIKRASELYSEVFVVVLNNEVKDYMFSQEDRYTITKSTLQDITNVSVMMYSGYVIDFCAEHDISVVVRGFRNTKDFEYETNMARWNREHGDIETLLLPQDNASYREVSSTEARQVMHDENALARYLSPRTIKAIKEIAKDGR